MSVGQNKSFEDVMKLWRTLTDKMIYQSLVKDLTVFSMNKHLMVQPLVRVCCFCLSDMTVKQTQLQCTFFTTF